MSARFRLSRKLLLPAGLEAVFPFFADAENLEKLTPAWLHFQIRSPKPIPMAEGTLIDYRLRIHGIPLSWTSQITVWDPPQRFVDRQIKGPYRVWIHDHRFKSRPGGTEVSDEVTYDHLGGRLVNRLFVRPDLERIFRYRHRRLQEIFGSVKAP